MKAKKSTFYMTKFMIIYYTALENKHVTLNTINIHVAQNIPKLGIFTHCLARKILIR